MMGFGNSAGCCCVSLAQEVVETDSVSRFTKGLDGFIDTRKRPLFAPERFRFDIRKSLFTERVGGQALE